MKFNLILAKTKNLNYYSPQRKEMLPSLCDMVREEKLATCVLQRLEFSALGFLLLATGLPFRGPEWFHCQSLMPIQKYRHIWGYKSSGQQCHHLGVSFNSWHGYGVCLSRDTDTHTLS